MTGAGVTMADDLPGLDAAQDQPAEGRRLTTKIGIDTEELTGRTFPYQFDRSLVEDVDLVAATPGADINWLEDVHLMYEDGVPAVFDRYTNAFLKIHFDIPAGEEDTYARKVLITHLREGNSYGIWLKRKHAKFSPNWVPGAPTPPRSARTGSRRRCQTGSPRKATRAWSGEPRPASAQGSVTIR
jgi:hypothetical protein